MSLSELKSYSEIESIVARYPSKISAIMPILHLIQEKKRQLTKPDFVEVAEFLGIPESDVFGVSTYYSMYSRKKLGKHVIYFCDNLTCMILDAEKRIAHLGEKYGMKVGETTDDGMFSLFTAECLGACGGAPAMLVDGVLYENVDEKKLDEVVEGLKK